MKKFILALTLATVASSVQADLSIDAFKQLSSGKKLEKTTVEMYVGGVVKGYLNANAFLSASNQPQMFCFSGDIDTGTAHRLASESIKEHLAKSPNDGKREIVEFLLLNKLRTLYPC
ncbi:MAG: hypothetical protein WBC07_07150 [Methylotenera sp.]